MKINDTTKEIQKKNTQSITKKQSLVWCRLEKMLGSIENASESSYCTEKSRLLIVFDLLYNNS